MRDHLAEIAATLEREVFGRIRLTSPAVFLVGAAPSAGSKLRDEIRNELAGRPRIPGFDVYYPEDLFEELLRGGEKGADLLELENMLAENVHAVVILLESPGAIAELGAFSNHEKLRDRLVVVVDIKHRRDRSFIMNGPINFLERKTGSKIIFHKLTDPSLPRLGADIRTAIRKVSENVTVEASVRNPIAAQHYMRMAIHVLHPITQVSLQKLVEYSGSAGSHEANRIVSTAMSILRKEGEVALGPHGYTLTDAGRERIKRLVKSEPDGRRIVKALDQIRINVMTLRFRRPKRQGV